jgi:hypothetical protein
LTGIEAAVAETAEELVEAGFVLVERQGARLAHYGVELGAASGICWELLGCLLVGAEVRCPT